MALKPNPPHMTTSAGEPRQTVQQRVVRKAAGVTIASSISFKGVSHAYGEKPTLNAIDLHIKPGEVVSLLGPSGSGKTTLLRLAAGLAEPKSGAIFINDREVSNSKGLVPPEKRGVGLVFQDFALFPHMSVLKNVEFGLTQLSKSDRAEHALRMLDTVGLRALAEEYPNSLSGGEQQRVALARALAPKPGILLMDEPFSGLDARLRDSVREETLALLRDTRSTVIIVTHDPEEAMKISDRIVLMCDGEVVQSGSCEELYHAPNSLFSARFFSELNIFKGQYDGKKIASAIGTFDLPNGSGDAVAGSHFDICVRPDDFELVSANTKNGESNVLNEAQDKSSVLQAYVVSRRPVGTSEHLKLAITGEEAQVYLNTRQLDQMESVSSVSFTVRPDKALIFPDT